MDFSVILSSAIRRDEESLFKRIVFMKPKKTNNILPNGMPLKIGIVMSVWHEKIIQALLSDVLCALSDCGVKKKNIFIKMVPGSFELPLAAKKMVQTKKVDAVLAIGCLIRGETDHYTYIASAVSRGIMQVGLETGVPVLFGVLTCTTMKQAKERSSGKKALGYHWGVAAVEIANKKK